MKDRDPRFDDEHRRALNEARTAEHLRDPIEREWEAKINERLRPKGYRVAWLSMRIKRIVGPILPKKGE